METILALDPGPTQSAFCLYAPKERKVLQADIYSTNKILALLNSPHKAAPLLVIEMVQSYGMPIGDTTLMTCVNIGRFIQVWGSEYSLISRKTVAQTLCNTVTANDRAVRRVVMDAFGGITLAKGKKANPGPLFNFHDDMFSALAIAMAYYEISKNKNFDLLN